jgi:hypothetical protein
VTAIPISALLGIEATIDETTLTPIAARSPANPHVQNGDLMADRGVELHITPATAMEHNVAK